MSLQKAQHAYAMLVIKGKVPKVEIPRTEEAAIAFLEDNQCITDPVMQQRVADDRERLAALRQELGLGLPRPNGGAKGASAPQRRC